MATTHSYEQIITTLVSSCVSGVDGVVDLSLSSGATLSGKPFRAGSSIQVVILNNMTVDIDVSVKAYYGAKVSEVSYAIQQAVKEKVEDSTPYTVRTINVNITGVVFKS